MGVGTDYDYLIPGVSATVAHDFRIDWTASGFDFSLDGTPVVPVPAPTAGFATTTTALPVQASNVDEVDVVGGGLSVDSLILNTHKTPGTFTSRVFDAGDPKVTGIALTPNANVPVDTTATYETRTAEDATSLAAANWTALPAGGAVANPKRLLQYRALLSATNAAR